MNFTYHSSIPVRLDGTIMMDSICGKQAEQEGYMCVNEEEENMTPFYMVKTAELPIFAQTDGFIGLAPTKLENGFRSFTQQLI